MKRALLAVLIITAAAGCAEKPLRFMNPRQLSIDELLALAPTGKPLEQQQAKPLEFSLRLTPQVGTIFAGGAVRVTCLVPQRADHRAIVFGVAGLRLSTRELEGASAPIEWTIVVERVPCGSYQAVCVVVSTFGRLERRDQELTARGSCNDDGSER